MTFRLRRFYGLGHLHFITCSAGTGAVEVDTKIAKGLGILLVETPARRKD
jgi:hypothetical protein